MIVDLLTGLVLVLLSFITTMIVCAAIGRTAEYFSRYKNIE